MVGVVRKLMAIFLIALIILALIWTLEGYEQKANANAKFIYRDGINDGDAFNISKKEC